MDGRSGTAAILAHPCCIKGSGQSTQSLGRTMEELSVGELMALYKRPSVGTQGSSHDQKVAKLVLSATELLQSDLAKAWPEIGGLPVMLAYSSDGTPLRNVSYTLSSFQEQPKESAAKRQRVGKSVVEVLVQNVFLRWFEPNGTCQTRALVQAPLPMTGKNASSLLACALDAITIPRDRGHQGIAISCYVFDGASSNGLMVKRLKQFHLHRAMERKAKDLEEGRVPKMLLLKEWIVSMVCKAHACHNALKWSMGMPKSIVAALKDLWIVLNSIRNSANLLHERLAQWLGERLTFVPEHELPVPSELATMWSALGLKEELVEALAWQWRLVFEQGMMKVSDNHAHDPDILDKVADAFCSVMSVQKFTESRWLTVGKACRGLTMCIILGLDSLVERTLEQISQDHLLNGYKRIHAASLRLFAVACGMSAKVADGVLMQMLDDSRGGLHAGDWQQSAEEDLSWLCSLPPSFWHLLASRVFVGTNEHEVTGREVQDKVLEAAHISMAFMKQELFDLAHGYPWKLGQGNIRDNLLELGSLPDASDPTTHKIQRLVQAKVNMNELEVAVKLLLECPWTTTVTEQQHASVSLLHRHHPDFQLKMLVCRACIHSLRRIMPSQHKEERAVAKLEKKLQALDKDQPGQITGRMMFLKELCEGVHRRAVARGRSRSLAVYQMCMKRAMQEWALKTDRAKGYYEQLAKEYGLDRADRRRQLLQVTLTSLQEARKRQQEKEEANADLPMVLSSCKLSPQALETWQMIFDRLPNGRKQLDVSMTRMLRPPDQLTPAFLQKLKDLPHGEEQESGPRPPWLGPVCHLREAMHPFGLVFNDAAGEPQLSVRVLYCKEQPQEVHCLRLVPSVAMEPDSNAPGPAWVERFLDAFQHVFTFDAGTGAFLTAKDCPHVPIDQVHVLPGLVFRRDRHVCSDNDTVPLREVMQGMPHVATAAGQEQAPRGGVTQQRDTDTQDAIMAQFPGLTAHLLGQTSAGSAEGPYTAGDPEDAVLEPEEVPTDEQLIEEEFAELEVKRAAWHGIEAVRLTHFQAALRAGTDRTTGERVFDKWQGQLRRREVDMEAKLWCDSVGLQSTMGFPLTLGNRAAQTLAVAWAELMEYLFQSHTDGLLASPVTTRQVVAEYREPAEFQEVMNDAAGDLLVHGQRVRAILDRFRG